jgi:hypothetical protein
VTGDLVADRNLRASVSAVDGALQLVSADGGAAVATGAELRSHQRVRTAKGSDAVLTLADGSTVEMAERSELSLRASRRGTVVDLDRGSVIVHAAPQGSGRLYVDTAECRVAVKGTIFAVNHGLKGSRVSVVEGEVEVRQGNQRALLQPGEQLTTDIRLARVPVAEEIAWSRNAEQHLALLKELGALHRDLAKSVELPGQRTSTRLLDLAPADTVVYGALPNLTEGLGTARQVFQQHLDASPTLRAWWEQNIVANGLDQKIDELLDRLQPLGEAVGDEVVVAVPQGAIQHTGGPVILAALDDPAGFAALLRAEVDRVNAETQCQTPLLVVDDPANVGTPTAEWLLWVHGDIFAAATSAAQLQQQAATLADPGANPFLATRLHGRLAETYAGGVEWLFGMEVGGLLESATGSSEPGDLELLRAMGLLDAATLVVEHHSELERSFTSGQLDFQGPRHGVAAWLAEPAPMGSLDFVSPDAVVASAMVTRDAAQMFDELLTMISSVDPAGLQALERFQNEHGIDLRRDVAAALGGEATLAVDVPLLPTPAWKLVVEVYDQAALQRAVEWAVDEVNREAAAAGKPGLALESSERGGLTYWSVRSLDSGMAVSYAVVDGFVVVAQDAAVIEQAIQLRSAGTTLATSATFRSLLPANGYSDCSALVYRNLAGLSQALAGAGVTTPEGQAAQALAELSQPSLLLAYGEESRISFTGTGGSLVGSLLGLPALLGEGGLLDGVSRTRPDGLSS